MSEKDEKEKRSEARTEAKEWIMLAVGILGLIAMV